jgi:hypothetical protein
MDEDAVLYDDIDSSRTIDEEVETLILQEPSHLCTGQIDAETDPDDVHIIGTCVERYTGREFSSCAATSEWMEWDATSHM